MRVEYLIIPKRKPQVKSLGWLALEKFLHQQKLCI